MKKTKFITVWVLIFGALLFFTSISFLTLTGAGHKKAIAATVKSDGQLKGASNLVEVEDTEPGFNGRATLCAVSNEQFQTLHQQFNATLTKVTVDGEQKNFVSIPKGQDLKRKDIQAALGQGLHCHIILQNGFFYLFFRGDVS